MRVPLYFFSVTLPDWIDHVTYKCARRGRFVIHCVNCGTQFLARPSVPNVPQVPKSWTVACTMNICPWCNGQLKTILEHNK